MRREEFHAAAGSYKLHYDPPDTENPLHRIRAYENDEMVGSMAWNHRRIVDLAVLPAHQRRGVARAMWELGQTLPVPPRHSSNRTDQGDAWAKAIGGQLPPVERRT